MLVFVQLLSTTVVETHIKSWGKDRTLHVVAAANENTGRCADDGVANGTNGAYSFGEKAVRSGG